jgi:glycosyltransferase involved in cell wall biosynthesis
MTPVGQPPISVVVPAFNRPTEVARALQSIYEQTYSGQIQAVVLAIGTDPRLVAPDAPNRSLTVVSIHAPCSPGHARNMGVSRSAHDLLAFLDDDDHFLPSKLSRQVEKIRDYDAVFTGVRYHANGRITDYVPRMTGDLAYAAATGEFFAVQSLLIRREAFAAVGGFDPLLPAASDQDFVMRLPAERYVAVVPEPLVVVERAHLARITLDYRRGEVAFQILREKHPHVYERHPEAVQLGHTRVGWLAFASGNRRSARYHARRALHESLGWVPAWFLLVAALILPRRTFAFALRARQMRWKRGDPSPARDTGSGARGARRSAPTRTQDPLPTSHGR